MDINAIAYIIAFLGFASFFSTVCFDLFKFFGGWSIVKLKALAVYKNQIGLDSSSKTKYPTKYVGLVFLEEKNGLSQNEQTYFNEWIESIARFLISIAYILVSLISSLFSDSNWLNAFRFTKMPSGLGIVLTAIVVAFGAPYLNDFLTKYKTLQEIKQKEKKL